MRLRDYRIANLPLSLELYDTMKYKCCECSFIFPCKSALDGYDKGIQKGFLCPSCNSNLKELFFKGGRNRLCYESVEQEKWSLKIILICIATAIIMLFTFKNLAFIVTFAVAVVCIAYGYYHLKLVPYPNVIGTEKIEE